MRLVSLIPTAAVALVLSGSALAQTIEYSNMEYRFSINFPAPPTEETTTYTVAGGQTVPAGLFTAERRGGTYTLIAVPLPEDSPHWSEHIEYIAQTMRDRDVEAVHDELSRTDRIPVQRITLVYPDGRRSMIAIIVYDRVLYVTEGNVPPGAPPPNQFQQSIFILDANGEKIRLAGQEQFEELNPR